MRRKIEKSHRNIGVLACENSPTNSLRAPFCFERQGKLCGRKTPALVELRPLRGGCKKGRKRCAKLTNKQTNKEREKITLLDTKDTSSMPSKLRVTFIQRFVHGKYNAIINRYNPAAIKATASEMRLYSTVKCVRLAFKTGKLYSPPKKNYRDTTRTKQQ